MLGEAVGGLDVDIDLRQRADLVERSEFALQQRERPHRADPRGELRSLQSHVESGAARHDDRVADARDLSAHMDRVADPHHRQVVAAALDLAVERMAEGMCRVEEGLVS